MARLDRRQFVAVASVASLGTAATAMAAAYAHPDAELLALKPMWLATRAAYDETFEPLAKAERACWDRQPDFPDYKTFRGSWTEFETERDRIQKVRETIRIETGVVAAEEQQGLACEADWAVCNRIFDMKARTVDGIRFKLEIIKDREGYEEPEYDASLLSDLLQMVGIHDA